MRHILLAAIAIALAVLPAPAQGAGGSASGGQAQGHHVANDRMPFPMLMNSLFGRARTTAPRAPHFAQPPRFVSPRTNEAQQTPTPQRATSPARNANLQPATRHVPSRQIDPRYERQLVQYDGKEALGSVVVDTAERFLYFIQYDGTAIRYGVGVGRDGFSWRGSETISRKAEWPDWWPPAEMKKRQPGLPDFMPGGPDNPLGARALYLGSTLYRIHGSNEPWTIGQAMSSGCIRMRNEDVIDLYDRVSVGARVVVR